MFIFQAKYETIIWHSEVSSCFTGWSTRMLSSHQFEIQNSVDVIDLMIQLLAFQPETKYEESMLEFNTSLVLHHHRRSSWELEDSLREKQQQKW